MNRLILISLSLLVATSTQAGELCSDWERKIEPDMQIQEAELTLEAYEGALERLAELGRETRHELSRFAEENAMKFVQGWLLRKAALESLEESQDAEITEEVKSFCEFLVSKAFYHD